MILLISIKTQDILADIPNLIQKKKKEEKNKTQHQSKDIYNTSLVSAVSLVYWFHCAVSLKVLN